MIQEAHEIRESQSFKNLISVANVQGLKQNITEESVSNYLPCVNFSNLHLHEIIHS